jgi:Na+/melibiose symporter-like transporter
MDELIIAFVLIGLASITAVQNICGCIWACSNKKKGIDKGYSSVPIVSLILCLIAYAVARDAMGCWVFIPTVIDPGTWMTMYLPWVIWTEFIRPKIKK